MVLTHELLAKFSPFNTLAFEYLDKVIEKASLKEFTKGALVFKRGRELNEAIYLVSGDVDLIDSQFAVTSVSSEADLHKVPLNNSSPTQVSAVAKSSVTVLAVERDFLDLVIAWSESGNEESEEEIEFDMAEEGDWMSSLLQSPLFNKIPPGNIRQLFVRFKSQKVVADEIIIREGERGEFFYVLETGSATVMDKQGNILAALRPGDYFGEEALVGDTTRNATVKMLTQGKLMRLGKEDFIKLLQEPVRRVISYEELQSTVDKDTKYQIIDVRLPLERRFQSIPNSRNIPLSQLRKTLPQLDQAQVYVVSDDAGRRADVAAQLMNQAGFDALILEAASAHQAMSQATGS
ncbi:MAG: cyclic nucleotide-binding domain-containing protein [Moraxellaceae bacterium]|nr:MAG: cyclic nucleotide-binding domain-containing protein [Moraxellaceae bacterium]